MNPDLAEAVAYDFARQIESDGIKRFVQLKLEEQQSRTPRLRRPIGDLVQSFWRGDHPRSLWQMAELVEIDRLWNRKREGLDEGRVEFYVCHPSAADPVLVYRDPDVGVLTLVNGHHRVEAADRRGERQVLAVVEPGTPTQATLYRDLDPRRPYVEWSGEDR